MTLSRREVRAAQLAAQKRGREGGDEGGGYDGEPGRTGWRKWVLGTLKWGSLAGLALLVVGAIGIYLAYQRTAIPEPNEFANLQVSIVYYNDGKTELDRIVPDEGNRESVALTKVPKFVQNAHIAAEDRTFYVNNGISVGGILRAVRTSVTGESQVGGSTITQQYVKNYFLSQDRTLTRKAKEILIAVKIDGEKTKAEILEDYLNTIYYGRGAYGIQSAAKAYFNKDVSRLTIQEGAVLASVINAPSLYDPAEGERAQANLENRFDYVLDGMVEEGWLTAADRAKITGLPTIQPYKGARLSSGTAGYITAQVKKELLAIGLTDADIAKGGLRITTTIERKAQTNAVKAMSENLPKGVQGGLVAIRPGDGAVVAMYGGADYAKQQLNNATQAIMQGGSNFKPFAVLAAVREGISTKTRFNGNSPQKFADTEVNNFGRRDYGMVDVRRMVGRSINTAFVALNEEIGPAATRQAAIDAGMPEKTRGLQNDLTNVLGTASPRVIDMASAYSTIASQGVRAKPYLIKKVTSTVSEYTHETKPETRRAFDKDVTADVTDAMTYTVKTGGTATKIGREEGLGDRPVAAKTGTSEQSKSVWFSGFVPQLAASVALYKPDANGNPQTLTDEESSDPLTGATIPADIWLDFMKPTLEGVEELDFPDRVGIGDRKVPPTTTFTPPVTSTAPPTSTTTIPPTTTTTTVPPPPPPTKSPPGKPTTTVPTTTNPTISIPPAPVTSSTKPGNR